MNKKADELLDLVDENDNVIGTVWKSEAHGDPTKVHREVDITVFTKAGEVLIQQRSKFKSNPGKWENTATGHALAGEKPEAAIKRELEEELGIEVEPVYFDKIFRRKRTEARFLWMYYAMVDKQLELKLDRNEVSAAKWIRPEELKGFAKNNWWDINGMSHKTVNLLAERLF